MTEYKVGDYISVSRCTGTFTGTIYCINRDIHIDRDDGHEGSGVNIKEKGKRCWRIICGDRITVLKRKINFRDEIKRRLKCY